MFSPPSNLDEWKKKNNEPKKETNGTSADRSVEDIIKEKKKVIAKNKALRETVYSHNFEGAEKITRRDFLKVGGALAGLWAIGKYGHIEKALNTMAGEKNDSQKNTHHHGREKESVPEINIEFMDAGEDVEKETEAQPLKFHLDVPIKMGAEDIEKAKNYWKERYVQGDLKKDFNEGVERMKPYLPSLKKIFRTHGVPEEYIFSSAKDYILNKPGLIKIQKIEII